MPEQTKVSVFLWSYNHAKYLREAIDSALNQTFSDFELIIMDDASTDDSWAIINSYSDHRIQAFRNKTNQLVDFPEVFPQAATGEYIAIHHSDDIWEPKKLERQVSFLDNHPEIGAVFTNAMIIGERGEPFENKSHFYYSIFNQPNRTRHEWLNFFFYHGTAALCHPSVLIRKTCYENCGLYRYWLFQLPDFDMWIRLCLKYEIHVLPEKLVRFRVQDNEANTSGSRPETFVRWQFEFLQILNNYCHINTSEEFIKVFPNANQYFKQEDFDIGFALGMVALEPKTSHIAKLFGLQLLFDALNDPDRSRKIKDLYDFSSKDFIALTAKHDVFLNGLITTLPFIEEAEKKQAMTARNRRAWTIIEFLWRLRLSVAPDGSRREQFAYILIRASQIAKNEGLLALFKAIFPEKYRSPNSKGYDFAVNSRKTKSGSPKRITFFVSEESHFQAMQPVAQEANAHGYKAVFSNDFHQPVEIGVYCTHSPDATNARFSIVMLHDLGQEQWPECPSLEPNFWSISPWSAFDIGILPGRAWSQCWYSVSALAGARPRLGVFELGWPKADRVFSARTAFIKEVSQLRKTLRLKDRPSVLYAPSFENDGKQDDFVRSLIHLPVNLLIKQGSWPDKKNRARLREITAAYQGRAEDGIYVVDPDVNIMTCLALSDVMVSDESNCLIEALLFDVPGIAVTDWLIPAIPNWFGVKHPSRFAEPPPCVIKTSRVELGSAVENALRSGDVLRPRIRQYRDHYFSHLGQSSALIIDVIDAALTGVRLPVEPLPPQDSAYPDDSLEAAMARGGLTIFPKNTIPKASGNR